MFVSPYNITLCNYTASSPVVRQYILVAQSELLSFQQVFFVESVCDDPEVIAANILVCSDVAMLDCNALL